MTREPCIYVAGHTGLVGSALLRRLGAAGFQRLLTATHAELDLCEQSATRAFLEQHRPDIVIVAAARVGGIHANSTFPANFIHDNLSIALNVIHESYRAGVPRLIYLGSTCIYPRLAPQPIPEEALLSGPLEPTNEAYAVAKIAGLKLCQHYRAQYGVTYHSVMPTNLYGPRDNYDNLNAHVLPALLRRFHEAREAKYPSVTLWGSGEPRREFLYVDDLADAIVHLLRIEQPPNLVNVGYGTDITIRELAERIKQTTGYIGSLVYDRTKPDGTPRKLVDSRLIRSLGWQPKVDLAEGIERTYRAFLDEQRAPA